MAFFKRGETDHAIRELQGKKVTIAAGAGANTSIAIAGIGLKDTIGSVVEYVGGVPTNVRTSIASIYSAGNIRLTSTTAGNVLVVEWYPKAKYKP